MDCQDVLKKLIFFKHFFCGSADNVNMPVPSVSYKNAPIFIFNADCSYNMPARLDFDGNKNLHDNAQSLEKLLKGGKELVPTVYTKTKESKTHYFVTYYLYYPKDMGVNCTGLFTAHDNDASSLVIIVRKKKASQPEKIEWLVTADHGNKTAIKPENLVFKKGHPLVQIVNGTHGMFAINEEGVSRLSSESALVVDNSLTQLNHLVNASKLYQLKKAEEIEALKGNSKVFQCNEETPKKCDQFVGSRGAWAPWARQLGYTDPIENFRYLYPNAKEDEYASK